MRHLFLCGLMLTSAAAAAQETTGDIRGNLRSTTGGPVATVRITASSPELLGSRQTEAAGDGAFQFLALPPGTYAIRIAAIGYRPVTVENVPVRLGRTTGLGSIALEPTLVVLEEITITAPWITLDPVRTTVGGTLDAEDYAALPAERDYKSLITILPHVNTSYYGDPANVGGSTGLENAYYIDGVNVTSPLNAATGTDLPANFVQSVEVRAGGYEAQYGRAIGAVVNAVTFTGSNTFEGEAFGFFTHDALTATPKAEPTLREVGALSYDAGARVSGPVVRDRLLFSAAYNHRSARVDRRIASFGAFPDQGRAEVFAGKLTWRPPWTGSMELSVFGDPRTRDQVAVPFLGVGTPLNPDPYLSRVQTGGVAASLRGVWEIGNGLRIEASLARSTNRNVVRPRTARGGTDAMFVDYVNGTFEGGMPLANDGHQNRLAGMVRGVLSGGRHTLGAGLEYERLEASTRFVDAYGVGYVTRHAAGYTVDSQATSNTVRNLSPAAYLQDAWRVADRLTVNAGLRWSMQTLKGPAGIGGQRFASEWQPRFGFSWLLDAAGNQRVFGSYSRFYQELPLNLSSLYYATYYFKYKYYSSDPRLPGAAADSSFDWSTHESDYRSVPGLRAENLDEFILGYERLLGSSNRLSVRGIRRSLRSAFQQGIDPAGRFLLGTPGTGDLAFLPAPKRQYTALEVTADGAWHGLRYQTSYVLSRTWGNYTGLFSPEQPDIINPGVDYGLTLAYQSRNSTGLLPNDRTHVFKFAGSRSIGGPLLAGVIFTWQSGTPLNDLGAGPGWGAIFPSFLAPRGSAGRTPSLWDLGLRLTCDLGWPAGGRTRTTLDLLHALSPRTPVRVDQQHYQEVDTSGNQTLPNPTYGKPVAYQPPMMARIGIEMLF